MLWSLMIQWKEHSALSEELKESQVVQSWNLSELIAEFREDPWLGCFFFFPISLGSFLRIYSGTGSDMKICCRRCKQWKCETVFRVPSCSISVTKGSVFSGLQDSPIHLLIWTPFSVISGPWLQFIIEIFRGAEISCRITTCSQDSPDSKWCQEHWQKMLHENCEKLRVGILRGTNRSDSRVTMIHWTNKAWLFLYAFKYHSQVHLVSPAAA